MSPREYLETALGAVPGTSGGAAAKNQIRASIKALFPDRDCFPLVRPMNDETKLQHLEAVPARELRPEFREGLSRLVALCFARAQPKRVGSHVLNGAMLAGLAQGYVEAINKGAVPTIATAWQGVAESECRRAADEAEALYHATFRAEVEPEEGALLSEHRRALAAAQAKFTQVRGLKGVGRGERALRVLRSKRLARATFQPLHSPQEAVGDQSIQAAHAQKWTAAVERAFGQLRDRRLAEAKSLVEAMISEVSLRFQAMSTDPRTSTADVAAALDAFLADFTKTAGGPTKWLRLVDFLKTTFLGMVKRADADARARDAALTARASEAEARLSLAKVEVAKLRTAAGNEEGCVAALSQQLDAAHKRRVEEVAAARREADAAAAAAAEQMGGEVRRLRAQLASAESASAALTGSADVEKRRASSLARQLEEVEGELRALRGAKGDAEGELRRALDDKDALTMQVGELQAAVRGGEERARALQDQLDAGHAAAEALEAEADHEVAQMGKRVRTEALSTEAAAAAEAVDVDSMTIQEMKEWLTEAGCESEVWELANRKTPRIKKADWADLVRRKM